jgi:DNA-binding PadR family transcriptional regulator
MQKINKELTAASSIPIILSILNQGETYGYEIIRKVELLSEGEVQWTDGMLYPVLHKLENKKLIRSEWRVAPETNRRRKYYRITDQGKKQLQTAQQQWATMDQLLEKLWTTPL